MSSPARRSQGVRRIEWPKGSIDCHFRKNGNPGLSYKLRKEYVVKDYE
jgi:hypothetical protein